LPPRRTLRLLGYFNFRRIELWINLNGLCG
jgi:hypothetical protein